ncbi:DUF11 domain-containing protein [Rugosimonospora africana]|uniref:Uncharacterized protein n=1 Tax=Rugosimonospora africana TaxID=556532 RepID=A0A8J3QZR7_9ACTN|nr:DUF11 domain-containing protein [Rugosimonospora africana]GIH18878.1 hypothetical protein Raf01_70500 [Rugosimonospora africana]
MSDFDLDFEDRVIAGAVDDYQEGTMRFIKPQGTVAAIATARRRRKVRVASIVAGVAVVVVTAGTAYAARGPAEHVPPPVIGNQNSPSPAGSPSASSSPSTAPTDTGTPSAGSSGAGTGASGPHDPDDLSDATLNLPAVYGDSCPHGATRFTNGSANQYTKIDKVLSADVDRDGSWDDVAMISCRPGEGAMRQVVAYHRKANGTFTTIGLVAKLELGPNSTEKINNIDDVKVSGSAVMVHVGDYASTSTDGGQASGVWQWRTYGWKGGAFAQTGGSTSFVADTSNVRLTTVVSNLTFDPPVNGKRTGRLTITVRNTGSRSVKQLELRVVTSNGDIGRSTACPEGQNSTPICQLGPLAAGASKTVTLTTTWDQSQTEYPVQTSGSNGDITDLDAQLRIGDQKYSDTMPRLKVIFN